MSKGKLPSLEASGAKVETIEPEVNEVMDDIPESETDALAPTSAPEQEPKGESYTRIFLHEKSRADDDDNVYVAVNGECLYLKRGTEVVLPQRFLEVLSNALVPIYTKEADINGRSRVGAVRRASYNVLGPATRADFLRMKADGKKSLRAGQMVQSRQPRVR